MVGIGAIIAAGVAVGSSVLALKYAQDKNPNPQKIQADLALMKKEVAIWEDALVPWEKEERDLLSYNQIHNELKEGRVTLAKGVFTSIYDEFSLLYSYKKYISAQDNALLYARTSNREYIYRIKGEDITIYMNGQLIGLYEGGQLVTPKNRILAKIDKRTQREYFAVYVEGREIGSLVNLYKLSAVHVRAFDLIGSDISPREESIFLAIAILEMIQISLRLNKAS